MTSATPRPETIRQLQRAPYPAYALLAGVQLDLFSGLGNGRKSPAALAEQLSLDAGKLQALMFALATTGLLSYGGRLLFQQSGGPGIPGKGRACLHG